MTRKVRLLLSTAVLLSLASFASLRVVQSALVEYGQSQAMLALQSQWKASSSLQWNTNNDCASWTGVQCDAAGNVLSIVLNGLGLTGAIPEGIALLSSLKTLNLADNSLTGDVPFSIGFNSFLENLILRNNQLNGELPFSVGFLGNLVVLDISYNRMTGLIHNDYQYMTRLRHLNMASNRFKGYFPDSVSSCVTLTRIDLSSNQLVGPITISLSRLTNLRDLSIKGNDFYGDLPASIFQPSLTSLDISVNRFSGSLPNSPLPNLVSLNLRSNVFSGAIPPSFGPAPRLESLDISDNSLNAPLPNLGALTSLTLLDLSYNALPGYVGSWVQNLPRLARLSLRNNYFTGAPPTGFSSNRIQWVDLSNNYFFGPSSSINATFPCFELLPFAAGQQGATQAGNCLQYAGCAAEGQRPASECTAFCNTNSVAGQCANTGYCFPNPNPSTPFTCACSSGFTPRFPPNQPELVSCVAAPSPPPLSPPPSPPPPPPRPPPPTPPRPPPRPPNASPPPPPNPPPRPPSPPALQLLCGSSYASSPCWPGICAILSNGLSYDCQCPYNYLKVLTNGRFKCINKARISPPIKSPPPVKSPPKLKPPPVQKPPPAGKSPPPLGKPPPVFKSPPPKPKTLRRKI